MPGWEVAVLLGVSCTFLLMIEAALRLQREHIIVKIGLLGIGFWTIVLGAGLSGAVATANGAAGTVQSMITAFYQVTIFTALLLTAYFIVYLVYVNFTIVIKVATVLGLKKKV